MRGVGRQYDKKFFEYGNLLTFQVMKFIEADHKLAHRRIEGESLCVLLDLSDHLIQSLPFRVRRCFPADDQPLLFVHEQAPEFFEETMNSFNSLCIPGFVLLYRPQEHLVHAEGISSITFHDFIGIDDIMVPLAHLFQPGSAAIGPFLQQESRFMQVRPPVPESLRVQHHPVHHGHIHVDFIGLIGILQTGRYELVRTADAIGDAGIPADLTLVDQATERFVESYMPEVVHRFCPHPAVKQMANGMLRPANIDVHLTPVITGRAAAECLIITGIHVSQKIPAAAGISGHGIHFPDTAVEVLPVWQVGQRTFSARAGMQFFQRREFHRQLVCRQGNGDAILPNDREWLAPVSLTAEGRVTHLVIDLALARSGDFKPIQDHRHSVAHDQPVEEITLVKDGILGGIGLHPVIMTSDDISDRQTEMQGETMVPLIPAGDSHDRARAIAGEDVFADPDRDGPACEGMQAMTAGEST